MNESFWHERWHSGKIDFHAPVVNDLLIKYVNCLALEKGARVFLPLCGKTLDIQWLCQQGVYVVGVELSELAVQQLFNRLQQQPKITQLAYHRRYQGEGLEIYVGDIFKLGKRELGCVDAIYDRAAYVALPKDRRTQYAAHVASISDYAQHLMITYRYDQTLISGPPFSINDEELIQNYGSVYALESIVHRQVMGGLKGVAAEESLWHFKYSLNV